MTLYDTLVAEGYGEPKSEPRAKPAGIVRCGTDRPYDAANAVSTVEVLDWLGIEHEPSNRGEMATCPGCGEHGALVCRDGGLKCLHDRCSGEGKQGFRSNVDIVAKVRGVEPREAVRLIGERFGLELISIESISGRKHANSVFDTGSVAAPPSDDDWVPNDADAPDAPPTSIHSADARQSTVKADEPLQGVADLSDEVIALIEARASGTEKPIPVPFADYQAATNGGIWCGSNETVVGLTGSQKSQFVSQKVVYAAREGVACLVLTLELTPAQFALRLLCDYSGVSWSRCEDGRATPTDIARIRAAKGDFDRLPIKVEYGLPQVFSPAALEFMIMRYRKQVQGPLYVVVDFAQLLGTEQQGQEARERVGSVFYGLQGVARRTGVAMTAVSSTARQNYALLSDVEQAAKLYIEKGVRLVGNPSAVLAAAKESGEAEYASDTLWVLCKWPTRLDNGDSLILAVQGKRRFGPCTWFAMASNNGRLHEYHVDSMSDLPTVERDHGGVPKVDDDEIETRVLEYVRTGKAKSRRNARDMVKGNKGRIEAVWDALVEDGRITKTDSGTWEVAQ
ncbi:MAG: DnaB-like helicase C-terminal domain-containing protein [Myxococcales bacterium]